MGMYHLFSRDLGCSYRQEMQNKMPKQYLVLHQVCSAVCVHACVRVCVHVVCVCKYVYRTRCMYSRVPKDWKRKFCRDF